MWAPICDLGKEKEIKLMKIKRKVQKTLPQLIEWAQDNIKEATKKVYKVNENEVLGDHVRFTEVYSDLQVRLHGYIPFDTTFTVEVEEEINECSDIKRLAHYTVHGFTSTNFNKSIGELRKSNSLAFYIMNDDRTLTLIWTKEKGMVE